MSSTIGAEIVNNKVLRTSVIGSIVFTFLSLAVGFLMSSQVIIFDGIFNLIGVILTYLSIAATKFIKKKDSWNFPFGKETLEPFIVITQYCIILYLCATNIFNALQVILDGGREVNIMSGVSYGVIATVLNIAVYKYMKLLTKRHSTAIAEVEIAQWEFSSLLSIGILIGFTCAWILEKINLIHYTYFIDPILTILITLIFAKTAILAIRRCIRELLMATPSEDITATITGKIDQINDEYSFTNKVLRLGKVGGQIIIEIDYVIAAGCLLDSVHEQDQLRNKVIHSLADLPYEKWINISFIGEMRLSKHLT